MAIENDFLVFAGGSGANVMTQAQYAALSALTSGFSSGTAQSVQLNKVWRQASIIAAMIAQFIVDETGQPAIDDGTIATLEANFIAAFQKLGRIKLIAPLNLYVSTTGSDTANTGLTSSSPFATVQHAANVIYATYDLNGNAAIINVAPGTYNQSLLITGLPVGTYGGVGGIQVVGSPLNPSAVAFSVTNANVFTVASGAFLQLSGVSIAATGSGILGFGIVATGGGNVELDNVVFNACSNAHMWAVTNGVISNSSNGVGAGNPYTIAGSAGSHWFAEASSIINILNTTITIQNSPGFANGFAYAINLGFIQCYGNTFTGAAGGYRYALFGNSVINTNGSGATYLPGSVAGTIQTGGQYT